MLSYQSKSKPRRRVSDTLLNLCLEEVMAVLKAKLCPTRNKGQTVHAFSAHFILYNERMKKRLAMLVQIGLLFLTAES